MSRIRVTTSADVASLPAIERSAGEAFRQFPDLAWIADDDVMSIEEHQRLVALSTCWVATSAAEAGRAAAGKPVGFLCAEAFGAELHIWELAVAQDAQGAGLGAQLMQQAITCATRDSRFARLTLTTFRDVPFNAPFYGRLGFRVLNDSELDARLEQTLAAEEAHGLPRETRCAMQLEISR